jgi:hypothetical protein
MRDDDLQMLSQDDAGGCRRPPNSAFRGLVAAAAGAAVGVGSPVGLAQQIGHSHQQRLCVLRLAWVPY